MNEIEFNQIAGRTRLSTKSREAARLVLVEGKRQVDVCQEVGIVASQLSRALAGISRESESHKSEQVESDNPLAVSRSVAAKMARDRLGEGISVRYAKENGLSIGVVLFKTEFHLVQDLGRNEVMIHELSKIVRLPQDGSSVELVYKNGIAESKQRNLEKQRDGVGR